MVYETFLKTIQSMVQTRLNKKANVSLRRVLKNNGLMLDGLSFTKPGSRLSPTVYLNAYYNEAEEGMPLSETFCKVLLRLCRVLGQIFQSALVRRSLLPPS